MWTNITAEIPFTETTVNHQLIPIPVGILSNIFNEDSKGDFNKDTLYSLCVFLLALIKDIDDIKTSAYIKALITFLVFPTHLEEKGYKATQYSGYLFKTVTDSDTHHRSTIEVMSSFIETTISKISASTKKQGVQEEIDSSESENSKQDNDTQDEPAKSSEDMENSGLDTSLINLDFDKTSPITRKRKPNPKPVHSESESSSPENGSDEESNSDDENSQAKRSTKRTKNSAPPQAPSNAVATQNHLSNQNQMINFSALDLASVFDKKKTYGAKLSKMNINHLRWRNKSIKDGTPKNINPDFQDILDQCKSKSDLPGELKPAIKMKCKELGVSFNLATLDEKFCDRLMKPAESHEELMISELKDISGFSFTGFIGRGMNYITVNGQKAGKPNSTSQLLDMIGHTWAYLTLERKKSALAIHFGKLYKGLKCNENQLRTYFDRGGEAFGTNISILIHNLTTSFLTSCYDKEPYDPSIHLTFHSEITQKIALNMYPKIKNDNNYDRSGSRNQNRNNTKSSGGGYNGNRNGGDDNRYNGNRYGGDDNRSSNARGQKRSTVKSPFIYTGKRGQLNKYLGRDAVASMGNSIPTDADGTRICFTCLSYENCTRNNCRFSHKINENIDKIESWMKTHNLPFKKRE